MTPINEAAETARADEGSIDYPVDDFPALERLQRQAPVHALANENTWLVVGFDAVTEVLANPMAFSSSPQRTIDGVLLGADPPEHGPVRKALAALFSADYLAPILAEAEDRAEGLIQAEFDAVNEYAVPLTAWLGWRFLGTDSATFGRISQSARAINHSLPLPEPVDLESEIRRTDLYARLAGDRDKGLSEAQAVSLVSLFATASAETTERLIARSVLALLRQPELRTSLIQDERLLSTFIEGILRLFPPEPILVRETERPVTLAGVDLPAGATVRLSIAAANRDPARFDSPHALRLDRSKYPHLSFGSGPHQCIGAGLGRRIAAIATATLLKKAPRFEAAEPLDQLVFQTLGGRRLPARLMIRC